MKLNLSTPNDSFNDVGAIEDYRTVCRLDMVPENVSFLAREPNKSIATSDIILKWRDQDQHLMIENFQPSEYYEDYLMTTSHSTQMQELQSSQVDQLLKYHRSGHIKSFVEIGCGDGSFLTHAQKSIENVIGIEPSKRFSEIAKNKGHNVINGFVSRSTILTQETFDAFASRQVFEHLVDPLDVLCGIRKMLKPEAVGLIEVPNGYRAIRDHRFYEFFPDHVNYYSVNSLVSLASNAGFNVICCQESFGGDYLELWVRNPKDVIEDIRNIEHHRSGIINNIKNEILRHRENGKVVALWGCGAKTLTMFSAGLSKISMHIAGVIDSDPNKQGLFIPNTNVMVFSPEQGTSMTPNTVIVLALSYRNEIAKSIRENYASCTEILTVDDLGGVSSL